MYSLPTSSMRKKQNGRVVSLLHAKVRPSHSPVTVYFLGTKNALVHRAYIPPIGRKGAIVARLIDRLLLYH